MTNHKMTAVMLFATMSAFSIHAMAADKTAAKKSLKSSRTPAAEPMPSVEEGMRLFSDPALGGLNNQKSCNSCHPSGKGLENAWKNPSLADRINKCIAATMNGKALKLDSVEMQSLVLYIKSLKPAPSGY